MKGDKTNLYCLYMRKKKGDKLTTPGEYQKNPLIIIAVLVFLLLISPFVIWVITPTVPVSLLVYTKTVPALPVQHHAGLAWFLHHSKMFNESGVRHQMPISYRGRHLLPSGDSDIVPLGPLPDDLDIVYISDTYGVYREGEGFIRGQSDQVGSNLLYGGMKQEDVDTLRAFLNRDMPNTIIAEYNTFATPTPPYIQTQLYEMFRSRWTGWTGTYVIDLSRSGDVPSWIPDEYEKKSGAIWNYTGSGFVLFNTDDDFLVLTMGKEIGPLANQFAFTPEGETALGLSGIYQVPIQFDIVEPLSGAEVLATYTLDVHEKGEQMLKEVGLSPTFPAIIRGETAYHSTYYLAGNWAFSSRPINFPYLAGLSSVMRTAIPNSIENEKSFFWHLYLPLMQSIAKETRERKETPIRKSTRTSTQVDGTMMVSRTEGKRLQTWRNNQWEDLFIHGINIGIAMPGKWFTDFPQDKSLYYRWLEQIGELGVNTIRIYTLLDPMFYDALLLYNQLNPATQLYLMQEIWPEEYPEEENYLKESYQVAFEQEIRHVIDAVHGNAVIPERRGRAWGNYTSDVSAYVLGYLVGRELEPHEVFETDRKNPNVRFSGAYITTRPEASPTEVWLASSMDYTLAYEENRYGWQHPVAIVNWPTLDPIDHPSERNEEGKKVFEMNDYTTVNINNILPGEKLKTGIFGAYHIYPNYPDFMNNDPLYDEYQDDRGRFRYGGYLREFMEDHKAYPAVVAEFGLATGMGNAHENPDGYHHGSMTEQEQGYGIIRMFEAMRREGYAGGIIFEWMDEWAKKTWTTEPYMIPYDRQILWHNTIDPEQNYGILALEAVKPERRSTLITLNNNMISAVGLSLDASYLHIDMDFADSIDFDKHAVMIGIDTYARDRGELSYGPDIALQSLSGMEFMVVLDGTTTARLLAIPPANSTQYRFSSYEGLESRGLFVSMHKLINRARALPDLTPIPARYEESSSLRYGHQEGATNHWLHTGSAITLRIPWGRINVSDPSSGRVLDDDRTFNTDPPRDVLHTKLSEGIRVSAVVVEKESRQVVGNFGTAADESVGFLPWQPWNYPRYRERIKESYSILQRYFKEKR